MSARFALNAPAALSHPPWTKGLERDFYMTTDGEKLIPFHTYVRFSGNCTPASQPSQTLWIFNRLPEEIQLHILAMCSASTLFQLMHVSSKLRIEASKL